MATTVHEPPKIEVATTPCDQGSGNGGWRNLVPADGDLRVVQDYSPPPATTGIWVVLVGHHHDVCGVHQRADRSPRVGVRTGGTSPCRRSSTSTRCCSLASSVTLEIARRRVAAFMGGLRQVKSRARRAGCTSLWSSACSLWLGSTSRGCN